MNFGFQSPSIGTSLSMSLAPQPQQQLLQQSPQLFQTNPAAPQPNTTNTITTAAANTLTFKLFEEYVNKWMSDLDTQEKEFLNQATQLNALDKLMIDNGEKIVELNCEVDRLGKDQEQIEQELDFINSQQNDLEASIKKLEDGIEKMPAIQQHQMSGDNMSRVEMYKLLIEVDNQLRGMSADLKDVIRRLNDTNMDPNDPTTQISKILNAHMDSLNWIEQQSNLIQSEVEKFSKLINDRSKDCCNNVNELKWM